MSNVNYSISDVYGFLDFTSDRKMSEFMPDAVNRIEESIQENNPLKNKFYKHMKLKKLSEATNTLSSPTTLSKDSLNSHSLEIEIEDGFIFDTRDQIYQHTIKLFDSKSILSHVSNSFLCGVVINCGQIDYVICNLHTMFQKLLHL